jgi:hypothetical protein
MQQRAFTFFVKDYDSRKRIYTLENPITKETRTMTKEEFDAMQGERPQPPKPK